MTLTPAQLEELKAHASAHGSTCQCHPSARTALPQLIADLELARELLLEAAPCISTKFAVYEQVQDYLSGVQAEERR